jgi:hypothetical protein
MAYPVALIKIAGDKMKYISLVICSMLAFPALAHHGSNGQFNHDVDVDVAGTVTDVRFVNPHAWVYFDVENDQGGIDAWRCEMRAGSLLKKNGWTEEMFSAGTEIAIHGSQARREEFGCYTRSITFADGRVVQRNETIEALVVADTMDAGPQLSAGTPVVHGRWVATERGGSAPEAAADFAASVWPAEAPTGRQNYAVSEAGAAAAPANFDREMNPRFHCQATNLFHDWWFDMHVNNIEQTDDKIQITFGFMDIERTIHMDMDEHPDNITPSRAGHSIGRWEGETLVVDTIGFEAGWLAATREAIMHSDQMHTVERYDLSEDGQYLAMTYVINDPLYLDAPYYGQLVHTKTTAPYDDYQCEDLTEERVEGF